MTSSRVVRGTKGRILLCIIIIIAITVIIACFNNILSQLDDTRRAHDQCHQQQENLSTQLQVIFDYKQRLEKSLKTEKAEHQQSRKDLENKLEEEQSRQEKTINELNLKYSSLQQHYNLLQTEHDDFKEESSKIQQQRMNEINDLQAKLKEVQGQFQKSMSDKQNSIEHLKTQFLQLQIDKENLEKQIKGTESNHLESENEINHLTKLNHELQREVQELKTKCSAPPRIFNEERPQLNISKQDIDDSNFQIGVPQNVADPKQDQNVADLPSNADEIQSPVEQVDAPKTDNEAKHNEQFNNNDNVLVPPNNVVVQLSNKKSSTTKSSVNKKLISKASLDLVQPLLLPTITSNNVKHKPSQESVILKHDPHVLPLPYANKKLPAGVVPVPDTPIEIEDSKGDARKVEHDEKEIRDDVNNAFPNRYRNNLIINEIANEHKAIEADKQEQMNEKKDDKQVLLKPDIGDVENNALEVFDPPLNNDLFNDKTNIKRSQQHKLNKLHANAAGGEGGKVHNGAYDAQDGADYDKFVQNAELEENDPEAEDDDPDYADHIDRQKDPAVRN